MKRGGGTRAEPALLGEGLSAKQACLDCIWRGPSRRKANAPTASGDRLVFLWAARRHVWISALRVDQWRQIVPTVFSTRRANERRRDFGLWILKFVNSGRERERSDEESMERIKAI